MMSGFKWIVAAQFLLACSAQDNVSAKKLQVASSPKSTDASTKNSVGPVGQNPGSIASPQPPSPTQGPDGTMPSPTPASALNSQLFANWASRCLPYFPSTYMKVLAQISADSWTNSREFFSDSGCSAELFKVTAQYSITGGGVADPINVINAQTLDTVRQKVTLLAASTDGATYLNARTACGFSSWNSGLERDISGQISECTFALGDLIASELLIGPIYTFTAISNMNLYMGDFGAQANMDGSSPEKRPTLYDPNFYFEKVSP